MVSVMATVYTSQGQAAQRPGSKPHTPGELEANAPVFLSPVKAQGAEFIPAVKPQSGRRLPIQDAFNTEAEQLKDAELDLRMGSKFEKVFGNSLYEGEGPPSNGAGGSGGGNGGGGTPLAKQGSMVKMNSFFMDPAKQGSLQSAASFRTAMGERDGTSTPTGSERGGAGAPALGLVARRLASATGGAAPGSGRLASSVTAAQAQAQAQQQQQLEEQSTEVLAFNDPDDAPVVARPRAVLPTSQSTSTLAVWEAQVKQLIASGRREEAVRTPCAPGQMARCYVKRVKSFFSSNASFQMFMDSTDVFLLAGRKRKKSKTSSYVVSLDLDDLKRDTDNCMAKLKANFVGTEYTLWGRQQPGGGDAQQQQHGNGSPLSPRGASGDGAEARKGYSHEQLVINFKQTALNMKGGPRHMWVIVPEPTAEQHATDRVGMESLSNALELARRRELPPHLEKRVSVMCTKSPEYDPNLKAYTLDFQGRVREASVKNFQLVSWDHNSDRCGGELLLQFGKMDEDVYALDFTYPFNVEVAFAVALASIDTKLCYTI